MTSICVSNSRAHVTLAVAIFAITALALAAAGNAQDLEFEQDSWGGQQDIQIDFLDARGAMFLDPKSIQEYWTQERMENAIAMPLMPAQGADAEIGEAALMDDNALSAYQESFTPEVEPVASPGEDAFVPFNNEASETDFFNNFDLFETDSATEGAFADDVPTMISRKGYPFTSRRVSPDSTVNSYPFRTIGKLFFSKPDGNYVCSASIINRRIVITAGHCTYDRETKSLYSRFLFVPAYRGHVADVDPFCSWSVGRVIVPGQWANSSGYPATDDFSLLQIQDRACNGATRRIGAYLGWLGWATYRLNGNNITQLGYPGNLDAGRRMQISQSNVYRRAKFAGEIGSAQGGGTSGGPWVQNFGVRPSGRVNIGGPGWVGGNQVVGVSSYGNVNHNTWQYNGASVLNNNFVRIWRTACAWQNGNCN